jgi:hypothetical protein
VNCALDEKTLALNALGELERKLRTEGRGEGEEEREDEDLSALHWRFLIEKNMKLLN